MKKLTAIIISVICLILFAGCRRDLNYIISNKPSVLGTVEEITDSALLITCHDLQGYEQDVQCWISLDIQYEDGLSDYSVGDIVDVFYDGTIAESYPLQINTVYAIFLQEPADRTVNEIAELTTTSIQTENFTEISELSKTEISTQPLEYAEVVHNYEREFYDFIELEDGFFDDVSNYENTLVAKEIKSDFEAYMAQNNDMLCFESFWIDSVVADDFDGNGTEETFIVVKGKLDFSNLDEDTKDFFESNGYYSHSGLYFVSDDGKVTRLDMFSDILWDEIDICSMYIYPNEKQLVVSGYSFTCYDRINIIYAYNGEEATSVLALRDMWYKDNCFINSDARVGISNLVEPGLWYWNKENFSYEEIATNRIHIDDFIKLLENSVVNDEEEYSEILTITEECNDIIGIANHIFLLSTDNDVCIVTLLEDGSFKINLTFWQFAWADNSNCDIDYFEAVKNMISVE
ncbi:MAG: hypothetical protein IJC04_06615 [Oscillospiraceae bacterium]|nr:hypothetical protein [Oscillospiraceae bacterium]